MEFLQIGNKMQIHASILTYIFLPILLNVYQASGSIMTWQDKYDAFIADLVSQKKIIL